MRQRPGIFPGRTAILTVLAACIALTASLYTGSSHEGAFFILGAAAYGIGSMAAGRINRPVIARSAGNDVPALQLLESAADELKGAMHIIGGFSEMIAAWSAREHAEWRDSSHHLVETTRQLTLFTAQLHDYARFERGALRLSEQQVDAAELVAAALASCEDKAERADVFIEADLSGRAELRCDALRLGQAITSLIQWVVAASPPGSVIGVCLARSADEGLEVRISNPSGLPPATDTGDPFEPRLPLKGWDSLALPIARRVALLHCGEVKVEAAQGAGTSASLCLPAHRVDWPDTAESVPPCAA